MTVQECYKAIEADWDGVLSRLRTEERVKKFLLLFLKDTSYELLCSSLSDKNTEEAFRAAHTIKGVSQNLSLTKLYEASAELSDILRNRSDYGEDIEPGFEKVKAEYLKTVRNIKKLEESE